MNMKTTLKYIALSMSAALMAACSPDYITPDQAKLPQAADFDVQVEVNQETNYVTFNMNNNGIVLSGLSVPQIRSTTRTARK